MADISTSLNGNRASFFNLIQRGEYFKCGVKVLSIQCWNWVIVDGAPSLIRQIHLGSVVDCHGGGCLKLLPVPSMHERGQLPADPVKGHGGATRNP